ncbi:MAG: ERF family protein [Acidobacteriota bacterium]|nr:ERF family protein [Acidobacteriota bacterium]
MSEMFADLLAAQKEMPKLQKTALNPFYHNKYVPLESVLEAALPILNAHNFVLIQTPSSIGGQPALTTRLLHVSGDEISAQMLLCTKDDGPQAQGSGITYARRYALLATLGLTADVDDDAEATRNHGITRGITSQPMTRPQRPASTSQAMPVCPDHGPTKLVPAGTSKAGKPYGAFYSCLDGGCKSGNNGRGWTMFEDKWLMELQLARGEAGNYDPNEVPFNE